MLSTAISAQAVQPLAQVQEHEFTLSDIQKLLSNVRVDRNTDYAAIFEKLDLDSLEDWLKKQNLTLPIEELNTLFKAEIVRRGLESNIIVINGNPDSLDFGVSPFSYGDLPYIKDRLGPNEKNLFNESPVQGAAVLIAGNTAMSTYRTYYSGGEDDNADAFRHALWMSLSASTFAGTDYSRRFGIAHENDFPGSSLSRSMDLFNNDVGISYGPHLTPFASADDGARLAEACRVLNAAVKNGETRRFYGNDIGRLTYLVRTNSNGAKQ